jgi:poly [ADP-ribose] polymerase
MRPPPVINSDQLLKEKIQMVESLADVAIATNLLRQQSTGPESLINPVDLHYEKLKCQFQPLDHSSKEFDMIRTYAKNTHGHTHNQYKLEVLEAFQMDREGELDRFNAAGFNKTANKQLLWHGSRLTNFVGIISQGLRIAPPEAPVTGYMVRRQSMWRCTDCLRAGVLLIQFLCSSPCFLAPPVWQGCLLCRHDL